MSNIKNNQLFQNSKRNESVTFLIQCGLAKVKITTMSLVDRVVEEKEILENPYSIESCFLLQGRVFATV
jgi:hypothetical protein